MKDLEDMIHEQLVKKAELMCDKYCKYGDQRKKESETPGSDYPTWDKYCSKCPMNEFFH